MFLIICATALAVILCLAVAVGVLCAIDAQRAGDRDEFLLGLAVAVSSLFALAVLVYLTR